MSVRTVQGVAADAAAALSGSAAAYSWLNVANDILQLVATVVAIIAGLYALRWHRFRLVEGKRHLDKKARMKQIEATIKELDDETKGQ